MYIMRKNVQESVKLFRKPQSNFVIKINTENSKKNPNKCKCQSRPTKSACGIKPEQKGKKQNLFLALKQNQHTSMKKSPQRGIKTMGMHRCWENRRFVSSE